jgi:hypothetical protein
MAFASQGLGALTGGALAGMGFLTTGICILRSTVSDPFGPDSKDDY